MVYFVLPAAYSTYQHGRLSGYSVIDRVLLDVFRPASNVTFFISIIVKAPVIQILSMLLAFAIIALDYPLPLLKNTSIHRSLAVRVVLLLFQAFLAIMFYQVRRLHTLYYYAF